MTINEFIKPYRVDHGRKFRMKDISPKDTHGIKSKDRAQELLPQGRRAADALQDKLYAQDRWSVLLIFQAMDAAGKDGTIKHVMSGINPQGCQVFSFKAPSPEELDHDFSGAGRACPSADASASSTARTTRRSSSCASTRSSSRRRSCRARLVAKDIWRERYEDINSFERYLSRNGVVIRKFFLHVSKEEQRQRFLSRLDEPEKNWKFSLGRRQGAQPLGRLPGRRTRTPSGTPRLRHAPWFVVPADHKWFTRLVVSRARSIDALEELDSTYPKCRRAQARRAEAGADGARGKSRARARRKKGKKASEPR